MYIYLLIIIFGVYANFPKLHRFMGGGAFADRETGRNGLNCMGYTENETKMTHLKVYVTD